MKRSGGFCSFSKKFPATKKVVLGLVTTKSPVLEKKEDVIARIHEAAKHVPLDRLYLSPQCGSASCEDRKQAYRRRAVGKVKIGERNC